VADTIEVFRENQEARGQRATQVQREAMHQHGAEFVVPRKGGFDRFMDGLNRLPRPALALGTLGLFVSAMVSPLWFAERMQGIALVPEPLWWLLGVIVSFYFGARHQIKSQQFQREIAATVAHAPEVMRHIGTLRDMQAGDQGVAKTEPDATITLEAVEPDGNAALAEWRSQQARAA